MQLTGENLRLLRMMSTCFRWVQELCILLTDSRKWPSVKLEELSVLTDSSSKCISGMLHLLQQQFVPCVSCVSSPWAKHERNMKLGVSEGVKEGVRKGLKLKEGFTVLISNGKN